MSEDVNAPGDVIIKNPAKTPRNISMMERLRKFFLPIILYIRSYIESGRIDIDILYMVTYMNSIATSNISRDEIFKKVSEREEYACSKYMKEVYLLAKNWNYEYGAACNLVARKVANKKLKDLLMRLSNAMSSGESEKKFLENEWQTMLLIYKNEYERSLESLKKWTDAYTALLVSLSFISITILLSLVIYNLGDKYTTIIATIIVVILVSAAGVLILRSEAPKEFRTHKMLICSPEQQRIKNMQRIILPIGVIVMCLMLLLGIDLGMILIFIGLIIMPMGLIGIKDDRNIFTRDRDFSEFTKMLGTVIGSMGVTVKEGITKVDRKSIKSLEPLVKKLYVQLFMGIDPRLCWMRFVGNSGSELINKFTHIFIDAIDMGGDATKIGKLVNTTNLEVVLLRMKRNLLSSSFINLLIPMHAAMVGLIIFVIQIMIIFSGIISDLYSTMDLSVSSDMGGEGMIISSLGFNLFQDVPAGLFTQYCIALVIILTIANTLAAKYVDGGDNYKIYYYGSIMCIISGICYIIVPIIVNMIFSFQGLEGGL
ncbi:archaellar assembly protein FlaJ [Methanocella conradii]|uniref:archaellar assembly protein FlaJ n=1 Tax=Methanocella conradii TaxID=1175444 RepID=UPI00157D8671|nr:archaellar assembly protein FlaJ [Methanocella conradii]